MPRVLARGLIYYPFCMRASWILVALSLTVVAGCIPEDGWYAGSRIPLGAGGDDDDFAGGLDTDGDGIPDSVEGSNDVDGDGIPNNEDLDSDGDGIPDADEGTGDSDGDGIPDFVDNVDNSGDDDDDDLSSDDDDLSSDDDDLSSDDDDTADDDDDDTADDDDDTADDDDDFTPPGDDDDAPSEMVLNISSGETTSYVIGVGQTLSKTIIVENTGGTYFVANMSTVTIDTPGTWTLSSNCQAAFGLSPASSVNCDLNFSPLAESTSYAVTFQGAGADNGTQTMAFTGSTSGGGGPTETSCTDEIDNDADLLIDCDDPDCGTDPACVASDFCCQGAGDAFTYTQCDNPSASTCVCGEDPWCCGSGWDGACVGFYVGCGGSC